jgi:hypothetical protein
MIDATEDDARDAEWAEDAPTLLEDGALPEPAPDPDDEDTTTRTVGRCTRCFRLVKTGGNTRPTFEAMEDNASDACYRSMDGRWTWCSGRRPFVLTLTG